MQERPLPFLFERPAAPTARQVADRVRAGDVAWLGLAGSANSRSTVVVSRRAGGHFEEIHCRSALNRVEGMPFRWTLNPYRGCVHGCHYCFARRYHRYLELNPGSDFSAVVFVKRNFVEVLRRELDRPSWRRELVAVGTATDPYQPIEGKWRLTRGLLEALAAAATPASIVTKGPLIVRDIDVLVELSRSARCTVCFSVPAIDAGIWRALEPGTAPPLQRLRAMSRLAAAGVRAGVLMAPVVPGITTSRRLLEETVRAVADHGARFMGANVLHLEGGTREHFMSFLAERYPALRVRYDRLYAGKYASRKYTREVYGMIDALKQRYGVPVREPDDSSQLPPEIASSSGPQPALF